MSMSPSADPQPSLDVLDRRQALSLGLAALGALLLSSCGDSDPSGSSANPAPGSDDGSAAPTPPPAEGPSEAFSTLTRVAADPTLAGVMAEATTSFGFDLYAATAAEPGNHLLSPVSVAIALAMTRAGAAGETAAEMDAVLRFDDLSMPHEAWNALDQQLESLAGPRQHLGEEVDVALSVVNRLWGQLGLEFEADFLDLLATQYGAGMHALDFDNKTEEARLTINEWVSGETNSKIPELLAPGGLSPDTALVLTNAIYFKAPWANQFSKDATTDRPFTRIDGSVVDVAMMQLGAPSPTTKAMDGRR